MAVTFSGNFSSSSAYMQLKATYNLVSQDITNNRSTIEYRIYLQSTGGWPWSGYTHPLTLSLDGVVYRTVQVNGYELTANGQYTIATGTLTVNHSADGTKTAGLTAYFQSAHGNATASGNYTLTTIPRASDLVLLNIYNATITSATYGQTIRFSIRRASSSFTTTIRYGWNGNTGTIIDKSGVTSYDWVVPTSWMNWIPESKSTWGTFYIDTYSGTTLIGTKSVTLTTVVPDTVVPSFSSVTVAEATTTPNVTAITGGTSYLQGASTLKFTYNGVTTAYGSAIASYKVSVGGRTYDGNNAVTDVFNMPGAYSAVATITDKRGRSASKTVNITITPYERPNLSLFTAYRTANGTSATVQAKATGSYSPITNNVIKYKLGYRVKGGTTYTYLAEETLSNAVDSFTDKLTTVGTAFTQSLSYDIEVTLYDRLFSTSTTISVGTAQVPLAWGKNGVGIGKIPTQGALDVKGDTYIEGNLNLTGTGGNVYHTGKKPTPSDIGAIGMPSEIPSGADLNNYQTPGMYYCPANVTVATISNRPTDSAFSLLVEKHAGVRQTVTWYQTVYVASWTRNFYAGTWGYWEQVQIGNIGQVSLSLENGCSNYNDAYGTYSQASAIKNSQGLVLVQGLVKGGTRNMSLTTLPSGWRPAKRNIFIVSTDGARGRLDVLPDGKIIYVDGNSGYISLSGIAFYVGR